MDTHHGSARSNGRPGNVRDNLELNRFELDVGGEMAVALYRIEKETMVFTSTQTPPALRGNGAASRLIHHALESARTRGFKVASQCSFVTAYLQRHAEFADLVKK